MPCPYFNPKTGYCRGALGEINEHHVSNCCTKGPKIYGWCVWYLSAKEEEKTRKMGWNVS